MEWIKNFFAKIAAFFTQENKHVIAPVDTKPTIPAIGLKKIKLGVIVGHDRNSSGATMCKPWGTSEYDFNSEVALMMKKYSKIVSDPKISIEVAVIYRDIIGISGAYREAVKQNCDVVIELHFNGFNGSAYGSSVLCTDDKADIDFSTLVYNKLCKLYNRTGKGLRGVKTILPSDRGGGNVHSFPLGPNVLIEPFFGDNYDDALMANEKKEDLAKVLVDSALDWARYN